MFIRLCLYPCWLLILATAGPILFQVGSNAFLFLMGYRGYDTYWSGYEYYCYETEQLPFYFKLYYCLFALIPALLGAIMLMQVAGWPNSVITWERRLSLFLGFFSILPGLLASQTLFTRVSWLFP